MKHFLAALKAFSDAAFWLSCSSALIQILMPASNLIMVPAIICAAVLLASLIPEKIKWLRIPAALLSAASLLFSHVISDYFMVVPLIVYAVFCVVRGHMLPDYYELTDFFPKAVIISLFAMCLNWITKSEWFIGVTVSYLLSLIFLMRLSREEEAGVTDTRIRRMEITLAALCVLSCFVVSRKAVLAGLAFGAAFVGRIVLWPFIMLLQGLVFVVSWIFNFDGIREREMAEVNFDNLDMTGIMNALRPPEDITGWTVWIPRVLGIIAFLGIAFLLFRRLFRRARAGKGLGYSAISRSRVNTVYVREKPITRFNARTPIMRIRLAYQNYIRAFLDTGLMELEPGSTSKDVLWLTSGTDHPDEARALREYYIRARYGEDETLNMDDVKRADELSAVMISSTEATAKLQEAERREMIKTRGRKRR